MPHALPGRNTRASGRREVRRRGLPWMRPSPNAGSPTGTTPDSCITAANASQCTTPVGAAGVHSYRRRPRAYSASHTIICPSTSPLQTPAPPSHRRRFRPPPPRHMLNSREMTVCYVFYTNAMFKLFFSLYFFKNVLSTVHSTSLMACPPPPKLLQLPPEVLM